MAFRFLRRTPNPDAPEIPEGPVQWRRFLGYLWPYKLRLLLAMVALLISSALSLVFPAVVQRVVDSVLEMENLQLLNQITIGLIIIFLFRSMTQFIQTYNLNYIGERIVVDLRKEVYAHLQQLSLGFFAERRVGELISRLASDVTVMRTALTSNVNALLQQSLTMAGSLIIMVAINWRLTLFIVAMIPPIVISGLLFGRVLRRQSTKVQDALADATTVAEESLQNIREVKSFVRESYETNRYDSAINKSFDAALYLLRVRAVFGPVVAFMGFGALALILWYGGREVIFERLTGGELIAFLIYGMTVAGSFSGLVSIYAGFQQAIGATKRVFQLIDTDPIIQDEADAQVLAETSGSITFEDVSFGYESAHDVLHNIDMTIQPGEIIALVGPSGAGKSTLFNLIPRFYDPDTGTINIDGHDIRKLAQHSLREQIGIVPQETLLFGSTVRENIRYGRLDADEDAIIEAAKAANAHDFIINELPNGYETMVGERGIKLSGGQRQRVAIARAILKNPRILLLDEATSSLDNESELLVQEALGRLMQDRTTIIIAHRLSTVRIAHRIAVLEGGRIIELGDHDTLMAQKGLYHRLYEMQFREQDLFAPSR